MPVIIPDPHSEVFPVPDASFAIWGTNLGVVLIANPAWVTAPTPAAVAASAAAFDAALVLATNPATRNTPNVAAKSAQRAASAIIYRDCVRQLVAQFRSGVLTGAEINEAGVRVPDLVPTPIGTPITVPLLSLVSAISGVLQMRAADSTTPASRKRPYGYMGLGIWRVVSANVPADGSAGLYVGSFTKQPMFVTSPPANVGLMCHYFARWYNARGEYGPWSLPVSFVGT